MIKVYQSKQNKKLYPYITSYIEKFLNRHKRELPKFLKVNIYDFKGILNGNHNTTGLSHQKKWDTGKLYNFILDINLNQLLNLYSGRELIRDKNRLEPKKLGGFRRFLIYVLYHEIGHWILRHQENFNDYLNNKIDSEIKADLFAYDRITQGQGQFDFTITRPDVRQEAGQEARQVSRPDWSCD
jgi:hypothetical protein